MRNVRRVAFDMVSSFGEGVIDDNFENCGAGGLPGKPPLYRTPKASVPQLYRVSMIMGDVTSLVSYPHSRYNKPRIASLFAIFIR